MAKEQEMKKDPEIVELPPREIMRADDIIIETNVSNFEYLHRKVIALQEEVELIQRILEQNNLKYMLEARANNNIEAKTWKLLEGQ